ncbi:MAG: hypothetical protein F4X83_05380 [Chloroflexi bacterium]|nr:hypothetical protein [Chloroflexota bacterium]
MAVSSVKRIVCLANSRKEGDRCIAGKELMDDGRPSAWVRPVSDREDEAVNERERQYADGSEPGILDVVDVPVREARPKGYQQENWLLDPDHRWKRIRRVAPQSLDELEDSAGLLWINGFHTHHGRNDRLPLERAGSLDSSLRLIKIGKLELDVFAPRIEQGDFKRRIKGRFRYAGEVYRLWVTDPVYEHTYLNRPNDSYQLGECFLTVSLGEPYQGHAYKLIAAIIEI